uniref:ATP-dependent DNA helicase n=1 Tax=Heligmosomoides polygyrus TaxID=6339 RepID=A0A183GEV9_HELPZ
MAWATTLRHAKLKQWVIKPCIWRNGSLCKEAWATTLRHPEAWATTLPHAKLKQWVFSMTISIFEKVFWKRLTSNRRKLFSFSCLLCYCYISSAASLWDEFFDAMAEDFAHRVFSRDQCIGLAYVDVAYRMDRQNDRCFFLNGPDGSGKTYLYNANCNILEDTLSVLCVAWTKIAANVLLGRRTVNSAFKHQGIHMFTLSICTMDRSVLKSCTFSVKVQQAPYLSCFCYGGQQNPRTNLFGNRIVFSGRPIVSWPCLYGSIESSSTERSCC